MSTPEPTASNTVPTPAAQEPPLLKFPPFPEPPPGVTIMRFKDFKPRGIQLFSEPKQAGDGSGDEGDVELDGLGIPTVELRIKHATDECKSNSRRKRKKKKTAAAEAIPVKKLPWFEEWEEGEDLRVTQVRYDVSVLPVDRFSQSAQDFRTGRPWPPISSGLNIIWDQFRLFTGLLINPSVFRKGGTKKNNRAESPDFESDEEDDSHSMNVDEAPTASDSRPTKRQRADEGPEHNEGSPRYDLQKLDDELREEKITIFLGDPEKAVRIFLSSYMREHGLIWAERNLIYTPRLISFFLTFVLRNRVLPEPTYQRGLKHALQTIEWAKKELPLTFKVGQSIPDSINEACRECFGRQGGINWSIVNATTTATEQKDATISVTDISTGTKTNVTLPTEFQTQLKDAIEDNIDTEVSLATPPANVGPVGDNVADENGWGDGTGDGWGGGWGDEGLQDPDSWAQSGPWADENQEGQGTNSAMPSPWAGAKWADTSPSWNRDAVSLISLLGPSAFPLTHTTGIVECSTRRVTAIHFPPGHPKGVSSPVPESIADSEAEVSKGEGWEPCACGIEAELDARFAKVVLEPWGREEGDISGPETWDKSRGPVVDPKNPSKMVSGGTGRKPHNPLTDNITLLVHPSFAETLAQVPGLGLGAMWIELARQKRGADGVSEVDTSIPGRFWYHEDVTGIFPSFYTPREKK